MAQSYQLPSSAQSIRITEITGMSRGPPLQSIATFAISPLLLPAETLQLSPILILCISCDLPTQPVHFNTKWSHLEDLHLADPDFGHPNKINMLLGIDVYADVLLQGRRSGPPSTPVVQDKMDEFSATSVAASHQVTTLSTLQRFWDIQECPRDASNHSP